MNARRSGWRKSSYSGNVSNCVEVRRDESIADVRDTKQRAGGQLSFSADAWHALLGTVQR